MELSGDRIGTEKDIIATGCALIGDVDQQLRERDKYSSESAENCNTDDLPTLQHSESRSYDEEQPSDGGPEVVTPSQSSEVAEWRACRSVVVYSEEMAGMQGALQFSWETDRAGCLRMLSLLLKCARLKMLMAWCSTLGGAHSCLGEEFVTHAEQAGVISERQLTLASEMGDLTLASQCRLYFASSLLQRGRLRPAAKIIREQYRYATKEATVRDSKLISMCLAAWVKMKHLQQLREFHRENQRAHQVEIQTSRK